MADRPVRLGDVIDDYCPRCRLLLNHDVASLVGTEVAKVTCRTCFNTHDYRKGEVPKRKSRKDDKKNLMEEVLQGMPLPPGTARPARVRSGGAAGPRAAAHPRDPVGAPAPAQEAGPLGRARAHQEEIVLARRRHHPAEARRRGAHSRGDRLLHPRLRGGADPRLPGLRPRHGGVLQGHDAGRDPGPDREHDADGRGARSLRSAGAQVGQALDGRSGRQDEPRARAPGRGLRCLRPHDLRARPRAHRGHPRQARVDSRLPREPLPRRVPRGAEALEPRPHRPDPADSTRRPEALRPARRHRHRREPAPHLRLDHEQEDGGGDRRPRPRRQDRRRRLPEALRGVEGAGADHGHDRAGHGQEGGRPHHRHGPAPRPHGGQRPRGRRVHRDLERPGTQGPRVPLPRARGLDAVPRRIASHPRRGPPKSPRGPHERGRPPKAPADHRAPGGGPARLRRSLAAAPSPRDDAPQGRARRAGGEDRLPERGPRGDAPRRGTGDGGQRRSTPPSA